jgi:hypothetical protein
VSCSPPWLKSFATVKNEHQTLTDRVKLSKARRPAGFDPSKAGQDLRYARRSVLVVRVKRAKTAGTFQSLAGRFDAGPFDTDAGQPVVPVYAA